MTYLIALIIAIALGAVIALLSFTNIGSGFSGQSERAQGQVIANAVSQVEIALAAYDAQNAGIGSVYEGEDFQQILIDDGWLRTKLQVPTIAGDNEYSLNQATTEDSVEIVNLQITVLSEDNCTNLVEEFPAVFTCDGTTVSARVY